MESEEYEKITKSSEKRNMYLQDYIELTKSAAVGFLDKIELITHEYGHAIAAKILKGSPIDIHFGNIIQIGNAQQYLFKLGNITIHGFEGHGSSRHRIYENETNKKFKHFLIKLMGPIFGITSLIIMKHFLSKHILKNNDTSYLNYYLKALHCICKIRIAMEILYGLTPLNTTKNGDGYQIWKLIDSNEKYIGKVPFNYVSMLHDFMQDIKLA